MFSLFPSPNGRILIKDITNNRQNYSVVYVSCFGFGRESGRKKETVLNGNKFPLSLIRHQFICVRSFDLMDYAHTKICITYF